MSAPADVAPRTACAGHAGPSPDGRGRPRRFWPCRCTSPAAPAHPDAAPGAAPVLAPTVPPAPPAPTRRRAARDSSVGFAGIAALGGAFAGFLSYGQNPDPLTTALAVCLTLVGVWVGLHVLRAVFRLGVLAGKIAIPVTAVLLLGNALDWGWAETATDWLLAAGRRGFEVAERVWAACRGA